MQAGPGTDYRIRVAMAAFITLALIPFSISHVIARDWFMVIGSGGVNLLLPVVAVLTYLHRDNEQASRLLDLAIIAIINLGMLFVLYDLGATGLYWTYLVVIANFYLVSLRQAVALSFLIVPGSLLLVYGDLPSAPFFRYAVTLPLVAVYAFLFSRHVGIQRQELARLAAVDQLTGAGNRRSFNLAVEAARERFNRYGEQVAMILLDIDHFKSINDTHGHGVGDDILAGVAARVRRRLRRSDGFFRYGGEEFVILAPHSGREQALHLAEELRREIGREPIGPGIAVTVSVGVAVLREGDSEAQWFNRGDAALYQAKQSGRNRVQLEATEASA